MPPCTHPVAAERRHEVVVAGVAELDSVLAGFGLATEGTFSVGGGGGGGAVEREGRVR